MAVNLSPIGNDAPFVDASGNPLNGGLLYTYTAGSSTPENTYTTSAGNVANANPIELNANGYPKSGANVVSIWLTEGVSYLFTLKTSAGVTVWSRDNIDGINDSANVADQWVSGAAPTYISAVSFSLVGDQTSTYHAGRRLKVTDSGGTKYCTIISATFSVVTTIVVTGDALASPTSAVSYSLLSQDNPAIPNVWVPVGTVFDYVGSSAPTGWLLLSGLTIGNAASGGTARANADTVALYTLLWNSMADAEAPVSTGRGANAAADFAANKTITLPDARGRAIFGKDDMGGSTASRITNGGSSIVGTTLGVAGGAQNRTIGTTNLPASGLSVPSLSVSATGTYTGASAGGAGSNVAPMSNATADSASSAGLVSVTGTTGTGTTGNMGSGNALATMNPVLILNKIIKL